MIRSISGSLPPPVPFNSSAELPLLPPALARALPLLPLLLVPALLCPLDAAKTLRGLLAPMLALLGLAPPDDSPVTVPEIPELLPPLTVPDARFPLTVELCELPLESVPFTSEASAREEESERSATRERVLMIIFLFIVFYFSIVILL